MTPNDFVVTMTIFQIQKVQLVSGFDDGLCVTDAGKFNDHAMILNVYLGSIFLWQPDM
jgi:hypothetical protein